MRIKDLVFFLFLLHFFPFSGFSQPVYSNAEQKFYLDFQILESEFKAGKYLRGDFQNQGFKIYKWDRLPTNRLPENRMITLRSAFIIDSVLKNEELYLASVYIEYPCNIYLNGNLIAARGNYKEGYTNRLLFNQTILLTPAFIKYDTINEIAFQLYPKEGETAPFLKVFISNAKTTDTYVFKRNFFNSIFLQAIGFCSIIFFIYFIFLYLSHRTYRQKQYLLFAILNLFFALSYVNQIFTFNFAYTFILEKIVRCAQPLLIYVSICFIIEYTSLFKKKQKIYTWLFIPFFIAFAYVLIQSTIATQINAYNIVAAPLLFLGALIMLILTILAAHKNRDLKSVSLLIVFVFFFFAILHDAYYFTVLHIKPYLLQVPYVYFYINLTIFFIMAKEQAQIYVQSFNNEKKLIYLNENLENLVQARTSELNEQSIKLKDANTTKDKFYSIIAHDLRNPFHTIIGFSDILVSELDSFKKDEALEIAKHINVSAKNTHNLLENLLNWAKSQLHLIPFLPENLNLLMLATESTKDIEHNALSKNLKIITNIDIALAVKADKNMLHLILRNLLTNAIKYSNSDGQILLSAKVCNEQIEIAISDSGIGMNEEVMEKLFKIGETIILQGTDNEKGSGLGLLLCKEFVEKHDGKIWVESETGKGSSFKFTLPRA